MADTFLFGADGSFKHSGVRAFGKDHTSRREASRVIEVLRQLAFLSHQFAQLLAISLPVGDDLAGNATLNGGLCHSH